MNKTYLQIELIFEKITSTVTAVLGNSITFIIAVCLVLFWIINKMFYPHNIDDLIRDVILSITFLTLFIIRKSFNRFTAILHLKVNELVVSHEAARNTVINLENKTEKEINEISKEYADMAKEELEGTSGVNEQKISN